MRRIMVCVDCCHFLLARAEDGVVVDTYEVHVWSNGMRASVCGMQSFGFFSQFLLFVGFVDLWWRPRSRTSEIWRARSYAGETHQESREVGNCLHFFTSDGFVGITLYHFHVDLSTVPLFILPNTSRVQNGIHIFGSRFFFGRSLIIHWCCMMIFGLDCLSYTM